MKKSRPSDTSTSATAEAILKSAVPRLGNANWLQRATPQQRAVVDAVISRIAGQPHPQWYAIADGLIEALGLAVERRSVVNMLQRLSGAR